MAIWERTRPYELADLLDVLDLESVDDVDVPIPTADATSPPPPLGVAIGQAVKHVIDAKPHLERLQTFPDIGLDPAGKITADCSVQHIQDRGFATEIRSDITA